MNAKNKLLVAQLVAELLGNSIPTARRDKTNGVKTQADLKREQYPRHKRPYLQ